MARPTQKSSDHFRDVTTPFGIELHKYDSGLLSLSHVIPLFSLSSTLNYVAVSARSSLPITFIVYKLFTTV